MNITTIKHFFIGIFLTNKYGLKLKKVSTNAQKKELRVSYAKSQLSALNIKIKVLNPQKIPKSGQYLLVSNHKSIIDPPIIELALEDSDIFGLWISKKELYNNPFFGVFVRNAGSVLVDRDKKHMSSFFKDIKSGVDNGCSIFIFPEGTRNKTDKAIGEFKEGYRLISLKNRLPILPVFIKTDAKIALENALKNDKIPQTIEVEFGDIIDYKSKEDLNKVYKEIFNLQG
jgi:1-acyl-sn-glycerol-3-phosphate acyltransferase